MLTVCVVIKLISKTKPLKLKLNSWQTFLAFSKDFRDCTDCDNYSESNDILFDLVCR